MLIKVFKIFFALVCLVILPYLLLPNFDFPKPPPDSLQSHEPADSETPLRRAYFTNYTRVEILSWYENQMTHSNFLGILLPTYRLNYPPEDARTVIRTQTRSTFLEEIVHPMRESVYVNGFEPKDPKDDINIEGRHWRQKIIIRFIPSSLAVRLGVFAGIIFFTIVIVNAWKETLILLKK